MFAGLTIGTSLALNVPEAQKLLERFNLNTGWLTVDSVLVFFVYALLQVNFVAFENQSIQIDILEKELLELQGQTTSAATNQRSPLNLVKVWIQENGCFDIPWRVIRV